MNSTDFKEHDVVSLREDFSPRLKSETMGVIVFVHEAVRGIYEVEFVDDNKETIDVVTVTAEQIHLVDGAG